MTQQQHKRLVDRLTELDLGTINALDDLAKALVDESPDATFGDLERAFLEIRETRGGA